MLDGPYLIAIIVLVIAVGVMVDIIFQTVSKK